MDGDWLPSERVTIVKAVSLNQERHERQENF